MATRQQEAARVILRDPAVESLSSFIGVDGTNITPNSGRIQINLKPLEERRTNASDIIRRLQPELAKVEGITLFLQPVQDLTVEDRVSRTQYQYSLEDPDVRELGEWVPRFLEKLKALPELRDVASDQQNAGLQAHLELDRATASRLGITPQMLDDALYDSFGQRQISTMFTQLNQYHVVLEVPREFRDSPTDLSKIYIHTANGGAMKFEIEVTGRTAHISRMDEGADALAAATQIYGALRHHSFQFEPHPRLPDLPMSVIGQFTSGRGPGTVLWIADGVSGAVDTDRSHQRSTEPGCGTEIVQGTEITGATPGVVFRSGRDTDTVEARS